MLKRIINSYAFAILLYGFILALALAHYYTDGNLILGGEGDFVLSFSNHLKEESFMWSPRMGVGTQNLSHSGNGLNIILLWLVEKLTGSVKITNFVLIFSIYFFPFLAMNLACKE